ncbi:LytTR family DNA-binding domain-containing protein [Pedobacter duraquae]|uniref:LytTR family DNA-binding domain-containing protein n=1 Tax=Pedobacter duraquae TaxID=425511 RepID=UPI001AAD632F|nr:LytTR family DNA-binding domain-containing protein [Pedobacter duraquae]
MIPFLALLLDQINMINNPQRSPVTGIQQAGFLHYLGYFFRQLYIFELITFAILATLMRLYLKWFNLKEIKLALKPIIIFQLQALPLFLVSILIFGPVTNFFRYLFLLYPTHGWTLYFPEFFMSFSMYFNYLFPIIIWGYLLINIDLLMSYMRRPQNFLTTEINTVKCNEDFFLQVIEGFNNQGTMLLGIADIIWFEVEKKHYYAYKSEGKFNIKKTLAELEQELNPKDFFRINRSQIINVAQVKNYSYWEFEKYIIRLTGAADREFVITRKRLKDLKIILETIKST